MEAETVTTYQLHYRLLNTWDDYPSKWYFFEEFESLEEAHDRITAEKEGDAVFGAKFIYKVVERSVTLRTVYQEVE